MKRYTFLGILFVSMGLIVALNVYPSLYRKDAVTQNTKTTNGGEIADMSIEGMYFIEQSNTGPTWQLSARSASFYDHKHMVLMHNVRAHLASDAPQAIYVEADYGQFDSLTGNLSVHGGVHLTYLHDYTIQTEALHWQATDRILQTDHAVQIASAFVRIAGRGLYGDAGQQNFVLRDDVHASFMLQ